jgi:hypothetical protein
MDSGSIDSHTARNSTPISLAMVQDFQGRPGETALVAATSHCHLDSAMLLLQAKADPNRTDAQVRGCARAIHMYLFVV